jgi:hypothetical protein
VSALSHSQSDERISFEEAVARLVPALGMTKKGNDYVGAPCPACNGGTTDRFNLKRCPTTGNAWLLCNAGCSPRDIWKGIFNQGFFPSESTLASDIKRQHEYYNPEGVLWGRKTLRHEGKDSWERYESGTFHYGVKNLGKTYPYRANHLHEQDTIFLTEGEKDAETLVSLGYNATSHQSLSNWDWEWFANVVEGKQLILVRDQDQSGIEQLKKFVGKCRDHGIANNFEVLTTEFGEEGSKTDITDWMQTHSHEDLAIEIATKTKPYNEWLSLLAVRNTTEKPTRFPLYTVNQLFELKEPDWLVEKLLPSIGVGILYAGSRQLKSFFTIGMAGCITNQATLGGFKVPENVRVAFGLLEGFYGWRDRLKSYQELVDRSFDPLTFNLSGFSLLDASHRRDVVSKLIDHDIRFLTIDTYSKASIGVNENSSNETAEVIAAAENIAHNANCCVLLVDHKGKDESRGIRGSSAKFANVDFVLEQTKHEKHISIYVEKLKNAEDGFYMNFGIATEGQQLAIPCAQQTCLSLQQEVDQALADGEDEKELKARLIADGYKDGSIRSAIFRNKKNATD